MAAYHSTDTASIPRRTNYSSGRTSSAKIGIPSSSYVSRPRSLGLFSPPSSSTSLPLSNYGALGSSPNLGLYSSSPSYSSGYGNLGSVLSTYGGTSSGYGGLTLYSPSSSNLSLSSSPSSSSYYNNNYLQTSSGPTNRFIPTRTSSFNRTLSSRSSPFSSLSSRSGSLSSLPSSITSEGYASGNEHLGHSSHPGSRSGSISNLSSTAKDKNENNEVDYKKLYEETIAENERLRVKLRETEDSLRNARTKLEGQINMTSRTSLSESEKRERRALERKLSEMEEELRQLQKLKAENERLKAENRALTRVVSKLTTSANATK